MPARYHVNLTSRASSDIDSIYHYIEADSPQNAAGVVTAIIRAIDSLETFPNRYPVYQGRRQPKEPVRRLPVLPYLVCYRLRDPARVVVVLTVRHGRRRPPQFGPK